MKYLFLITCGLLLYSSCTFAQVDFVIIGSPCVDNQLVFESNLSIQADSGKWEVDGFEFSSNVVSAANVFTLTGTYKVQLTIYNSGTAYPSKPVSIEIHDNPSCGFLVDSAYWSSFTRVFTDTSSNNAVNSYSWNFGDGSVVKLDTNIAEHKYNTEGTYNVTLVVSDVNGCIDSVSHAVNISNIFKVPNVFTPNGDQINDNFVVKVNGVDRFSIEIFSRWGSLVFKREGVNQIVWDGRLPDGSIVNPGTYFYIITASDSQKAFKPKAGYVMVF